MEQTGVIEVAVVFPDLQYVGIVYSYSYSRVKMKLI
jgi:hypothetical protein